MRGIRGHLAPGAVTACVVLSACGEVEAAPDSVVVDSAGVVVVENRRAVWSAEDAWRIEHEPEVEIGGLDVAPEYALYNVASALRLADGRILVGDRGSSELRLYDESGVYLESKGGPGEGPGEFGNLWTVTRYRADSLLIWDSGNVRLSVHDADGDFRRSFKLAGGEAEGTIYFPGPRLLPLEDGSVLGFEWLNPMGQPEGLFRPVLDYLRFSPTGEREELVLRAPYQEWMLARFDPGRPMQMRGQPTAMTPLLFGRESFLSVHGGTIWVGRGRGDGYTVEGHANDGSLLRRVENRTFRPVAVEDRHVDAEIEGRLESMDAQLERMPGMAAYIKKRKETLEKLPIPEFFPPYQDLRTSVDGHVWVQAYAPPGVEPTRWSVFDPEGTLLGDVELPRDFEVMDIGPDYVLGTFVDEYDVEHVRLHRIVRPAT
ncbi:MAG: hypothetical protein PVI57_02970 [Gemmatimonadota bacterium]|jgi:hypothetical protein